jgi:sulfhydrogenase subunit beta (sulfur reductase)
MKQISQIELNRWLDRLAVENSLIAPQNVSGVLLYRTVKSSQEIAWGFTRPEMSVKDAFFPMTDQLLSIQKVGGQVTVTETLPDGNQVIFGVRPCDAQGLMILDKVFIDKQPVDPYYALRRQNSILIGLACRELHASCFCTSVGGAPDDASHMDIMLYLTVTGYALEGITSKGQDLLASLNVEPEEVEKPVYSYPDQQYPNPGSIQWTSHFTDDYWQTISDRCLSCRVCAYVCPTCRCFITRDEPAQGKGNYERLRCWDSCNGANYRMVAGGHRPRSEKSERLRNRFLCKFYYFTTQYGLGETSSCTGCGRCVDACPVNVDITEVLNDFGRTE